MATLLLLRTVARPPIGTIWFDEAALAEAGAGRSDTLMTTTQHLVIACHVWQAAQSPCVQRAQPKSTSVSERHLATALCQHALHKLLLSESIVISKLCSLVLVAGRGPPCGATLTSGNCLEIASIPVLSARTPSTRALFE